MTSSLHTAHVGLDGIEVLAVPLVVDNDDIETAVQAENEIWRRAYQRHATGVTPISVQRVGPGRAMDDAWAAEQLARHSRRGRRR